MRRMIRIRSACGHPLLAGKFTAAGAFFCAALLAALPVGADKLPQTLPAADAGQPPEKSAEMPKCVNQADAGPEMVLIAGGTFDMGSPNDEAGHYSDETRHSVTIKIPYAIGRCEVTVGEFKRFVAATGYPTSAEKGEGCYRWNVAANKAKQDKNLNWRNPGFKPYDDSHPVVCVSWDDAQAYIQWLNTDLGLPAGTYRLPSEAEWEYAARAGTQTAYFWGAAEPCGFANGADQTAKQTDSEFIGKNWTFAACSDGYAFTAPVGRFQPNGFGLYDTAGNAWEWVQDCYHDDYQGGDSDGRAKPEDQCEKRALRGGSWSDEPSYLRSAIRYWFRPDVADINTGFRLARTL
ncbi:formylglycine-generating enzyme family protein [Methylomonas sp. HYX-M1]|uniref:formylglycine-generating enzyme family protein n=1 Tax=Methylomonas sp. HYX-M1 TaxID=3139307 RepID=UPI00345C0AF1